MNKFIVVVIVAAAAALVYAAESPVEQCHGENYDDLKNRIKVTPCGKSRCKLPKLSNITVEFKFNPKGEEVKTLTNEVYADILGVPLPFLGVTGFSACDQVTFADTGAKAPCPLKPNVEYLYTNVFPVETFYPEVSLRVHWSLNDGDRKVICFEVPAAIVPAKKKHA